MFMIFLSISLYMSVKNVRNESRKVNVAPPPFRYVKYSEIVIKLVSN